MSLRNIEEISASITEPWEPVVVAEANGFLVRFLPILDQQLSLGDYVLGKLSIVDFAMAAQLEMVGMLEVKLDEHQNVVRWLQRMQAKPYWKDA